MFRITTVIIKLTEFGQLPDEGLKEWLHHSLEKRETKGASL